MVKTRSGGASEPLESLLTPPKRTRKPRKPLSPIQATAAASPEVVTAKPVAFSPWRCAHIAMALGNESLTTVTALTPSNTNSTKRPRDESDSQEGTASTKRARTQSSKPVQPGEDYLFMFPKKHSSEDEEYEVIMSTPSQSYADEIRRKRIERSIARRRSKGPTPRRKLPVKMNGDNPFGFETFTAQEKAAQTGQHDSMESSPDRHDRDERSAAPEPETPRRGLFGSLREFGSAAVGRASSLLGNLTPQSKSVTPSHANTAPHAQTEPRRPRIPTEWDVQYPAIEPVQGESSAAHVNSNDEQEEGEEETETEKKRNAFEARYGKPDKIYDHLHTMPLDGRPENLTYPPTKKVQEAPTSSVELSEQEREMLQRRKERREKLHGKAVVQEPPKQAPLFGPNSHYARGTVNPALKDFFTPGVHPAMRKFASLAGTKRSHDESLQDSPASSLSHTSTVPKTSQQPTVEDESVVTGGPTEEPSTPINKKQKTIHNTGYIPQTPRSALKAPGTIGKSGRSARFNDNPIMSIKPISPIYGNAPAGEYAYSSDNLFGTFADDALHQKGIQPGDSPASTSGLTPSPRTVSNTAANTGRKQHPGDALSKAIQDAEKAPMDAGPIQYQWRDENNPDWRPSLGNPRPGCFRVPDDDDEEDMLAEFEREQETKDANTPEPPSTPRMSHAELPKASSTSTSTSAAAAAAAAAASASALEAANLERRRAEATKTKPRTSSRLAEVTSARSRSPSPPVLDAVDGIEGADASDSSVHTPSPTSDTPQPAWTWSDETNEYLSSTSAYPDFAHNLQDELVPSFCLKTPSGIYDDTTAGPDKMTEAARQAFYATKYNDAWAEAEFAFDEPQTYEEAGVGTKYIHDMIRKNDERHPEVVQMADERFQAEWEAHQQAIDDATAEGKKLIATYPDRDGVEMQDAEDEEL